MTGGGRNNMCVSSIDTQLANAMRVYMARRKLLNGGRYSNYVFISKHKEQLSCGDVSRSIKDYVMTKGVGYKGADAFRNSLIQIMYQNGSSVEDITRQTGYKDIAELKRRLNDYHRPEEDLVNTDEAIAKRTGKSTPIDITLRIIVKKQVKGFLKSEATKKRCHVKCS